MSTANPHVRYLRRSQGRVFTGLLIFLAIAPLLAIALAVFNLRQAANWASHGHTSLSAAFHVLLGSVNPEATYSGALIRARDHLEDAVFALASVPVTVLFLIRLQRRRGRERALLTLLKSARPE